MYAAKQPTPAAWPDATEAPAARGPARTQPRAAPYLLPTRRARASRPSAPEPLPFRGALSARERAPSARPSLHLPMTHGANGSAPVNQCPGPATTLTGPS